MRLPTPPARRRLRRLLNFLVPLLALGVAAYEWNAVPHATLAPALLGLIPYTIGKYVICPLRWHQLSASGQGRRWHLRVYAESEVLGMLSPAHAGADLWRAHRLRAVGLDRPSALLDVGIDRVVGSIGTAAFAVLGGATLPPRLLAVAGGVAAVMVAVALMLKRRRPDFLRNRPLPSRGRLVRGVALSVLYQLSTIGLLLGTVGAVGHDISPLALLGVFGASQVAAIVPGVHGAGPREGALVAGLVALGLPFRAALGAISLAATLAWLPALLIGGGAHVVRHLRERQAGLASA